jgi:hypothetical protein
MTVVINTPIRPSGRGYRQDNHPTPGTATEQTSNEEFLGAVLGNPQRFHYSSRDKLHVVNMPVQNYRDETHNGASYEVATVSLAVQAVHQAFAAHVALSLRPDTAWYFIVHEVAEYVRQNSAQCAGLFTDTPESKQTILVRDDSLRYNEPSDWQRSINLIREPLAAKVSDRTMRLFLPTFSTSTFEDETALLVALMDTASPYYRFEWQTMCGIPQIRLEGDSYDWDGVYSHTEALAREFPGLSGYFEGLLPVLEKIYETIRAAESPGNTMPDEDFWRSIYKFGGGSGGPFVSGWITAFFAFVQTDNGPVLKEQFDWQKIRYGGYLTNEFPSHVSKVPFVWDYMGNRINMAFAAGVTGVDYDGTFLSPRLGFAVVEV